MNDMVKIPKYDGGAAFAHSGLRGACIEDNVPPSDGMSLRDYFAASALQGVLAQSAGSDMRKWFDKPEAMVKQMSVAAYMLADAMLKARQDSRFELVPRGSEEE